MGYLSSYRGDFVRGYGRQRGDPFFGVLAGALPLLGKAVSTVKRFLPKRLPGLPGAGKLGAIVGPAAGGALVGRMLPGPGMGLPGQRRRRMNPANPKALRRAIRRQAGFIKLAQRTLRGSGFTVKRTGLPKGARPKRRR